MSRAARALAGVLPQWVTARVIVLAALGFAHLVVDTTHPNHHVVSRVHQGLLAWDAGWYDSIAAHGYAPLGHQSLRFFPLLPLAARLLAVVPGVSDGLAVVVIANLSALGATALLAVLVRRETGDRDLARRATWLISLAPPAFVFVMGYTEGLLLFLTVGCFIAIRRGLGRAPWHGPSRPSWWLAALLGFGAGLTTPLGVLLTVPVAVEAGRRWARSPLRDRISAGVAIVAPVVGGGSFFIWSAIAFGDAWLPLRVQSQVANHGGLSDPLHTLLIDARGVFHHHFGTAVHVPWVLFVIVLLVVTWYRWPTPYGAFATAVVLVAVSGTSLASFERFALSAFPLTLTGATLTASRPVFRCTLVVAGIGLALYASLAFLNVLVP